MNAYKPRSYQVEAVDASVDYIASNGKAGLICLPVGTGKSGLPALIFKRLFDKDPYSRALMLTHRKTLIEQNHKTLMRIWPTSPCGIYSAGLKRKDEHDAITYAGIQSVHKKGDVFGHIDTVVIDEAHLVPNESETMYVRFLNTLRDRNPKLSIIGMTATPFRLKSGMLVDGDIFDHTIIDRTLGDKFTWFIDEGYLVEVHNGGVDNAMDPSDIKKAGGEFVISSMSEKFNRTEVSEKIVDEVIRRRGNRKCGITFAIDIAHAEELCRIYNEKGVPSVVAHSKLTDDEVERNITQFTTHNAEMLIDVDRYTTGFDLPEIDLIVAARLTESSNLWIQMLGRGSRPVYASGFDLETKVGRLAAIAASRKPRGCLCLDFAGNSLRLGPMNAPVTPHNPAKTTFDGEMLAPMKRCPECERNVHAAVVRCPTVFDDGTPCSYTFPVGLEVAMSGEIIPGLLIRRDGLREDRLFEVREFKIRDSKTFKGTPFILLTLFVHGRRDPFQETMYLTPNAAKFNSGTWNKLLPNGPKFPYHEEATIDLNIKACMTLLNRHFTVNKIVVWMNHQSRGQIVPKIVSLT